MNNEKVKFLLNWNHFGEHLSSCMTKLMTDSSYSDIIIATGDKHLIYSHRFVLANSSKYFQRLFKHMAEPRGIQLVVALPEVKYETFKILMNYMYKGETQVPHELLPSVIKAGQFLEINGLVNLNEIDGGGNCETFFKPFQTREVHSKCVGTDQQLTRIPATLRDNIHPRENHHPSLPKGVQHVDKSKREAEELHAKSPVAGENGKENRSKFPKSLLCKNLSREQKDVIQLPLKRKPCVKDTKKITVLPSSSSSLPNESCPPKKLHKKHSPPQNVINVKVKEEVECVKSPVHKSEGEGVQNTEEKVTIKMEVPDEVDDEVVYNELQCEFCHEIYINPPDWVRHMTEKHGDRGFQSYREMDKSVGGTVITCVVCSSVCFSAAEWAKHLQTWHSDRELTFANLKERRKNLNKNKKRSGIKRRNSNEEI